eukprot:CAMPEP_0116878328 /NCGR_PEP_ID=MMETSP0463-20121206/10063_1 /TAXON_ID=181622 /ORGANISM="Strombidinopsis sp, Strain SopsisLIS2011" /LENGTH=43 /DNA_ID= /DNA_START= /DNA_END= /DNA_ORIENTATION=
MGVSSRIEPALPITESFNEAFEESSVSSQEEVVDDIILNDEVN